MNQNFLSLSQIKDMVEKKFNRKYKWVEGQSTDKSEEGFFGAKFRCLVPEDAEFSLIDFTADEGLLFERSDKLIPEPVDAPVFLWDSELLEVNGEKGVDIEGALNGVLLLNGVSVTQDDIALLYG